MICSLCKGAGNLTNFQAGKSQVEFFTCPSCGGFGARTDVTTFDLLKKIQAEYIADPRTRFIGKGRRLDAES